MELAWLTSSCITRLELASLTIALVVELYLRYREYKLLESARYSDLTDDLKKYFSPDLFERSRKYDIDTIKYRVSESLNNFIINTAYLYFSYCAGMWRYCTLFVRAAGLWPSTWDEEIGISLHYYTMSLILGKISHLPFSIYQTFVIEESYGFNRETIWLHFKNLLIFVFGSLFLYCPLIAFLVCKVKELIHSGTHFDLYFWLNQFIDIVLVFIIIIILWRKPWLDEQFTPLPKNALRSRVEMLTTRTGFPLSKIYIKYDKSTGHSNAYFFGVFTKVYIVLFDSLLKDLNINPPGESNPPAGGIEEDLNINSPGESTLSAERIEEVAALVAHELGHWNGYHTLKIFTFYQLRVLVMVVIFLKLYQHDPLFEANGFRKEERPVYLAYAMVYDLFFLFWILVEIFQNWCGRKLENEADFYAVRLGLGEPLKAALCKLYAHNLHLPFQDPLRSALFGNHPTLQQRIENIDEAMKTVQ